LSTTLPLTASSCSCNLCVPWCCRIAKLLLFATLVPETVPCLPSDGTAAYVRRLWRHPATGMPCEVRMNCSTACFHDAPVMLLMSPTMQQAGSWACRANHAMQGSCCVHPMQHQAQTCGTSIRLTGMCKQSLVWCTLGCAVAVDRCTCKQPGGRGAAQDDSGVLLLCVSATGSTHHGQDHREAAGECKDTCLTRLPQCADRAVDWLGRAVTPSADRTNSSPLQKPTPCASSIHCWVPSARQHHSLLSNMHSTWIYGCSGEV
jgi:hypothetical protein